MAQFLNIIALIIGAYAGIWCLLIKGIMSACALFDAGMLTGATIGWTILKCFLAGPVTVIVYWIFAVLLLYIYYGLKKGDL